jgi:sulfoxide reductase heme-binding subunit YedZ
LTNLAAGTLGPTAYWYATRATGFVALILLSAVVVLGVMGPMRISGGARWPRFAIDSMHRDVSLLAIALIVVHVITTVLDGFAPISLIDGIIPFHSAYRPLWLGLGAVAFDLMLALAITSLVRRRLGYRSWRAVHWLAYVCWPVTVLHGLGTGSDSKQVWGLLVTFACVAAVAAAVAARISRSEQIDAAIRTSSLGATILIPLGLVAFTLAGPLAPHWAERAGTPSSLLFSAHRVLAARTVPSAATASGTATTAKTAGRSAKLHLPFTASLDGSIQQTVAAGGEILDIELQLHGGASGALRIRLAGQADGQGLSMVGSQVDLVATGLPSALQGKVTSLDGSRVLARVAGGPQRPLNLTADLQINQSTGTVTGTLHGRTA